MPADRRGVALVISAPSGAGKSTLTRRLTAEFPELAFSVSCTTRPPREGEVDGRDYHFLDREEFLARREAGGFAEWAEVHGNFYGTPRDAVMDNLGQGRDTVFEIDVQGAAQLRESVPGACLVFILPPSTAELRRRLEGRGTDAPEVIRRRLDNSLGEMARADLFDYWIVNDDLDQAYDLLRAVYLAQTARRDLRDSLPASLAPETGTDG